MTHNRLLLRSISPLAARPRFGSGRFLTGAVRLVFCPLSLLAAAIVPAADAELVYGVTRAGFLVSWDSASPNQILGGSPITGLQSNETLVGIDMRPATGEMYGVGSTSRLYKINPANGAASMVGGGPFNPLLNGSNFGVDFNPVADRLRITSNADQNLRINVDTLAVLTDGTLKYDPNDRNAGQNPNVVHSAYTNSFKGAQTTTLYDVDAGLDVLTIQNPPNDGVLTTVGPIGTDITEVGGFDISGATGKAFMVILDNRLSRSTFWSIDLGTAKGTMIGEIGGGETITAMTIIPEPGSVALTALAAVAGTVRRR